MIPNIINIVNSFSKLNHILKLYYIKIKPKKTAIRRSFSTILLFTEYQSQFQIVKAIPLEKNF